MSGVRLSEQRRLQLARCASPPPLFNKQRPVPILFSSCGIVPLRELSTRFLRTNKRDTLRSAGEKRPVCWQRPSMADSQKSEAAELRGQSAAQAVVTQVSANEQAGHTEERWKEKACVLAAAEHGGLTDK